MRKYGNDGQFTIVIPSTRHVSSRPTRRQRQDGDGNEREFEIDGAVAATATKRRHQVIR